MSIQLYKIFHKWTEILQICNIYSLFIGFTLFLSYRYSITHPNLHSYLDFSTNIKSALLSIRSPIHVHVSMPREPCLTLHSCLDFITNEESALLSIRFPIHVHVSMPSYHIYLSSFYNKSMVEYFWSQLKCDYLFTILLWLDLRFIDSIYVMNDFKPDDGDEIVWIGAEFMVPAVHKISQKQIHHFLYHKIKVPGYHQCLLLLWFLLLYFLLKKYKNHMRFYLNFSAGSFTAYQRVSTYRPKKHWRGSSCISSIIMVIHLDSH